MDPVAIAKALDDCLLNDKEMMLYREQAVAHRHPQLVLFEKQ